MKWIQGSGLVSGGLFSAPSPQPPRLFSGLQLDPVGPHQASKENKRLPMSTHPSSVPWGSRQCKVLPSPQRKGHLLSSLGQHSQQGTVKTAVAPRATHVCRRSTWQEMGKGSSQRGTRGSGHTLPEVEHTWRRAEAQQQDREDRGCETSRQDVPRTGLQPAHLAKPGDVTPMQGRVPTHLGQAWSRWWASCPPGRPRRKPRGIVPRIAPSPSP